MAPFVEANLSDRLPGIGETCPVLLILREAESRLILKDVPEVLDTLYELSAERLIVFPFASSFLETIDQIMDPIVAKHGCGQQGIYYLTDVAPVSALDAVLARWGACPVVGDQAIGDLPQRAYHAKRQGPMEGTQCHWYRVSRGAHFVPQTLRHALPVEESREAPARRRGVLAWLG